MSLTIIILWVIWNSRNKIVHEGVFQMPLQLHTFILRYMRELTLSPSETSCSVLSGLWTPLVEPWVRVNFYVGFFVAS